MDEMNRKRLEVLRAQYPVGCIVVLVSMDGQFAPPKGTRGEILSIDDTGTIHVIWRTGSTLGVVPGVDMVRKLDEEIPTK
ncbi:MAG: DUF4314 domain-containing protein [Spirochaetia bacterium]|nr:DUF4314 domain-containing protein [Spirochaetia bacterium]